MNIEEIDIKDIEFGEPIEEKEPNYRDGYIRGIYRARNIIDNQQQEIERLNNIINELKITLERKGVHTIIYDKPNYPKMNINDYVSIVKDNDYLEEVKVMSEFDEEDISDLMDIAELQTENERLHSIIKEVREYIENKEIDTLHFNSKDFLDTSIAGELLEILDKVDKE